jgi:hypothetical protein
MYDGGISQYLECRHYLDASTHHTGMGGSGSQMYQDLEARCWIRTILPFRCTRMPDWSAVSRAGAGAGAGAVAVDKPSPALQLQMCSLKVPSVQPRPALLHCAGAGE